MTESRDIAAHAAKDLCEAITEITLALRGNQDRPLDGRMRNAKHLTARALKHIDEALA